jgi:uncharacterized protein (TIGR01777 family)
MPEKVLITGGSGLVGTRLTELLLAKGWQVVHLGRHEGHKKVRTFRWDPSREYVDADAFEGVTSVVHLAGASIAGRRWTNAYKRDILNSRIQSTRLLHHHLTVHKGVVSRIVSASAIGLYGAGTQAEVFTENDPPGFGFLADVVRMWEAEANLISSSSGIPVALVRTGIVLSDKGGALTQMARPVRLGLGSPLGSGDQLISWIHIDDLCRVYIHLLEKKLAGPFNATAGVISNTDLTRAIAKQLDKPLWLTHVPAFALKLALGELSDAVLTGSNVSSGKIENTGFEFRFRTIEPALSDLLKS